MDLQASFLGGYFQIIREGFFDLNEDANDGCEYECTVTDPLDPFDAEGRDENCDGFDGLLSQLIFVSPDGDDANDATKDEPVASFAAAMVLVEPEGSRRTVVLAEGTYDLDGVDRVAAGISVHGGFRNDGRWTRDSQARAAFGETVGALRIGGGAGVVIESLELSTSSRNFELDGPGAAAVGLIIEDGDGLRVSNIIVRAGEGTGGSDGRPGLLGASGLNGANGGSGCENSSFLCSSCDRPRGGAGGSSPCANPGGSGGQPGHENSAGNRGSAGLGEAVEGNDQGFDGAGGAGGAGGSSSQSGSPGAPGAAGPGGELGVAGAAAGSWEGSTYQVASGATGANGHDGGGAGGGGGGGGGNNGCDTYGGAAGGGGGAGCFGTGGGAGSGGGASVALLVLSGSPILNASVFSTLGGGAGGNGAWGGSGGVGGDGGNGGASIRDSGVGGPGGNGGDGGAGGHGGGGGGGPSIGVWLADGSAGQPGNSTFKLGPVGAGGMGGRPEGSAEPAENPGREGLSRSLYNGSP